MDCISALDRRLARQDAAPIVVGFSGGGDSLSLLRLSLDWAARRGRHLVAVTVDHQIRPEGAQWARWCAARCLDLGVTHLTKIWEGAKPATGLPAAAREARHRLLAEAAREAGARVILLGHTADDALETAWMRRQGLRTPAPREWAPSPVWPQGWDQFLLRPLISARRAELRSWLHDLGETWIDDPANEDAASPRIRARGAIARGETPGVLPDPPPPGLPPFAEGKAGELTGRPRDLRGAEREIAQAWLGAALTCVGGGAGTPPRKALQALLARIQAGGPFAATLAGARLIVGEETLCLARETGDRRGGGGKDQPLLPGEPTIWDGRFEILVKDPGWSVGHLAGRAGRLGPAFLKRLHTLAAPARPAVPALLGPSGEVVCPTLMSAPIGEARSLVMGRLVARCGAIQHESDMTTWRNAPLPPKS